jgi:hypothetical protein
MRRIKARSLIVAVVVTVAALAVSATAYAAGSAGHTYSGAGGQVQTEVQTGANDPQGTGTETSGGLPFTGLDLTLMLGGGLVLIASGVALGRLMIRRDQV